jgi:hypothetical protein
MLSFVSNCSVSEAEKPKDRRGLRGDIGVLPPCGLGACEFELPARRGLLPPYEYGVGQLESDSWRRGLLPPYEYGVGQLEPAALRGVSSQDA